MPKRRHSIDAHIARIDPVDIGKGEIASKYFAKRVARHTGREWKDDDGTIHELQKLDLAWWVLEIVEREWFKGALDTSTDIHMARLLFSIYRCGITGNALGKKSAWNATGLADIKTARKYIAKAVEMGLVEVYQSKHDKRIELLYPSDRLEELVEAELLWLFDQMREVLNSLLAGPLPDTGAPLLYGVNSPELDGLKLTRSVGYGRRTTDETPQQTQARVKRRLGVKTLPDGWSKAKPKK